MDILHLGQGPDKSMDIIRVSDHTWTEYSRGQDTTTFGARNRNWTSWLHNGTDKGISIALSSIRHTERLYDCGI